MSPFSPLNAPAEVRLRKLLASKGIDANKVTSTTWCGSVVHLFCGKTADPAYTIAVSEFA
jgi:hypothetical protein